MRPLRLAALAALLTAAAGIAAAQDFARVTDRGAFVDLVEGRELTRFGIALDVTSDGRIAGNAFGGDVTGSWEWSDGYFCRSLAFGSRTWERDCQLVLLGGDTLRFVADRGEGDTADLRLE